MKCSTLPETDRRTLPDRRKKPTPMLSRYILFGLRQGFRRESDREKGGYADRYSPGLFFFLVTILCLNILDVFLANMIIYRKGWKLNPVILSAMAFIGERFWVWKFVIISLALIFVCLLINFKPAKKITATLGSIYFSTVLFQISLLFFL